MATDWQMIATPIVTARNPHSGVIEQGREYDFRDLQTGQVGKVWLPGLTPDPAKVEAAINVQLAKIRETMGLGGGQPIAY